MRRVPVDSSLTKRSANSTETEERDDLVGLQSLRALGASGAGEPEHHDSRGRCARFLRARAQRSRGRRGHRTARRPGTFDRDRAGRGGPAVIPATSRPRISTVPRLGTNPPIAFMIVDFPAPFEPISPTISPRPTSRSTASTAMRVPKRTVSAETCIATGARRRQARVHDADRPLSRSSRRAVRAAGDRITGAPAARRAESRSEYRIWTSPPGKNRSTTRIPAPPVSSATFGLFENSTGIPTTNSAPRTAPGIDAEPADDHDRNGLQRLSRAEAVGPERHVEAGEQSAGETRRWPRRSRTR